MYGHQHRHIPPPYLADGACYAGTHLALSSGGKYPTQYSTELALASFPVLIEYLVSQAQEPPGC
jgi:hypothetical protein